MLRVPGRRPSVQLGWPIGVLFLGSLALYIKTLAPTILWGDPAKLTRFAYTLNLHIYSGTHSLRNFLGWLWGHIPFTDYAYGQNLLSAVFAVFALLLVYFIVYLLTKRRLAAFSASASLGLAHTFWWLAVMAESYSLLSFLLLAAVLAALLWRETHKSRWLFGVGLLLGIGTLNHEITPLFGLGFLLYFLSAGLWRSQALQRSLVLVAGGLVGLSPLLVIFATLTDQTPWQHLLYQATFGSTAPWWGGGDKLLRELPRYPLYLLYQFPSPAFVLGLIGIWIAWKRDRNVLVLLLGISIPDVLFASAWLATRQPEIMVPSYLVFSLFIGYGAARLQEYAWPRGGSLGGNLRQGAVLLAFPLVLILPLGLYYQMPRITQMLDIQLLSPRTLPHRDNPRYFYLPDKSSYTGARDFGEEVFASVKPGSLILGDFTPIVVLEYLQVVERKRPDIQLSVVDVLPGSTLTPQRLRSIEEQLQDGRAIYLLDIDDYEELYRVDYWLDRFDFVAVGPIYQLKRKSE